MGNLFPLRILKNPCVRLPIYRNRNILRVMKIDGGEVMEFTAPLLVKELLTNFEGFVVTSSKHSSIHLPLSFRLQLGKTYYLLPCNKKAPDHAANDSNDSGKVELEPNNTSSSAVKRIKVVITKKQLQELLSNKTSLERIILGTDHKTCSSVISASANSNWKPRLAPIPEEND